VLSGAGADLVAFVVVAVIAAAAAAAVAVVVAVVVVVFVAAAVVVVVVVVVFVFAVVAALQQAHPYDSSLLIAAARVHDMLNDTAQGATLYKKVRSTVFCLPQ
jgi:hypothetical protein